MNKAAEELGAAADRAMGDGKEKHLPSEWVGDFVAVRRGFAKHEAGDDAAALESVKGVGVRSPFAEWRLLLRGLVALAVGDRIRAAANFARLSPHRLPARAAAPLRPPVDADFAASLPPAQAKSLGESAERLSGTADDLKTLRAMGRAVQQDRTLAGAFAHAKALNKRWAARPDLQRRLGRLMYSVMTERGVPEDCAHYRKALGPPPEDPDFARLAALMTERADFEIAHQQWQAYERFVANSPQVWPPDQAGLARAMVWHRMGHNALRRVRELEDGDAEEFAAFTGRPPPRPLEPSAVQCFRKAAELAPEWPVGVRDLLLELAASGEAAGCEALARDAARRFPEDFSIQVTLGGMYRAVGDIDRALEHSQKALDLNPFDRGLRAGVSRCWLDKARQNAVGKKLDAAGEALATARELRPEDAAMIDAAAAAFALKAGDRAEFDRLRTSLNGAEGEPLATYRLHVEAVLAKVPKKERDFLENGVKETLAGKPAAGEAAGLIAAFRTYRHEPQPYRGAKSHEAKFKKLAEAAVAKKQHEEADLLRLARLLAEARWNRQLSTAIDLGVRRFGSSPWFPLLAAEQELDKSMGYPYKAEQAVAAAEARLRNADPADVEELTRRIEEAKKRIPQFGVGLPVFGDVFEEIFGRRVPDEADG